MTKKSHNFHQSLLENMILEIMEKHYLYYAEILGNLFGKIIEKIIQSILVMTKIIID